MKNKPILLVAGEPDSVFIELFLKSLKKKYNSPLILICNKEILIKQMKNFSNKLSINDIEINKLRFCKTKNNKINLINVKYQKTIDNKGKQKYILECFKIAFKLIDTKFSHKLINGPINKKIFLGKKYLGVTEFIANYYKIKKFGMLIFNKKLSVSPVTTHLPIKLVNKKITKKLIIQKIKLIHEFYKKYFKLRPKIAVAGLNPHCETILDFDEDEKIIARAIKSVKKNKIYVEGPYSGDTLFLKSNRSKFNVILGMYHDQVLGPIKTLFEYDAINITMGLPFMRVSPDHGTNQKMVGKNKSNPLSLIRAIEFVDNR